MPTEGRNGSNRCWIEPPLKPEQFDIPRQIDPHLSAWFAADRHFPDHRPRAERGDGTGDEAGTVRAKLGCSRAGTGKDQLVEIQ